MSELDSYLFKQLKTDCNDLVIDLTHHLINQNYCHILNNQLIKDILNEINLGINESILESIETKFNLKRDEILQIITFCGISSLQLYVFDNFLSFIKNDNNFDICLNFMNQLVDTNDYNLSIDGEQCYSMARSISLLKLSRFLLIQSKEFLTEDNIFNVLWRMRSAIIHQISLSVPSNTIYEEIKSYSMKINDFIDNGVDIRSDLKIELYNEMLSIFLWFGDIDRVITNLKSAQNLSGLTIGLSGALGVRTQYQQKPVSQLMVTINRISNGEQLSTELDFEQKINNTELPKNVVLKDDTLLQSVKFVSKEDEEININTNLSEVEQTLMLSFIRCAQRIGSSSDELLREEIHSYLEFLIEKSSVWSVLTHCFSIRSLLEKDSRRRVERSMTQINELVDGVRESTLNWNQMINRYQYFYSVLPNPFWITERYLANILLSLGVTKSALDIYLRLDLWDDIIDCYQRIGRRDKAEAIVRDQLKDKETPYLYCLLGDTTDNIEYYEKSWQLSDHKYPRAQKSLGNYYFNLKQYSDCIPYFKRSLDLNSMQTDVWFHLGFAAIITENYELAATAYRRVVQFESNSYESWNNLSKAYIKLGQKKRSWKTLQEAIKCNYDEWKIWDNYIAVSIDIGAFAEVIHSWHRLIDIKGQYIDDKIANILINSICEGILDCNQESAAKLASKAQKLFGRIVATSKGSTNIWRLYAKLLINNKVEDIEKVIQCLQNCHRNAIQLNRWEKEPQMIVDVLKHCLLLADEYNQCISLDSTKALRVLSSSKLALNSVIVLIHKNEINWSESELKDEIQTLLRECGNKLQSIIVKIQELN